MNSTETLPSTAALQQQRRLSSSTLLFLGDCVVVGCCMILAYYLRYTLNLGAPFTASKPGSLAYFLHYSAGFALFFLLAMNEELYDMRVTASAERSTSLLVKISLFWAIMSLGGSLILKFQPPISRLFVGYTCILLCLLMPLWRVAYLRAARRFGVDGLMTRRVAILGCTSEGRSLALRLSQSRDEPYEALGVITSRGEQISDCAGLRNLGSAEDLEEVLDQHPIDVLAVADVEIPKHQIMRIAKACERRFIEFNLVPGHFEIFTSCLALKMMGGHPVMGVAELPQNRILNRMIKRGVDIVGSLVGLILTIPLIAALAIIIKHDDKGPAFFLQTRVGQNGKPFKMIKLRSMKMGAEASDHLFQSTQRDDPRVLKCGAFMRRWNIDELPQFLNVLKGEMSLVGPRPERVYYVNKLLDEIPYYQSRHSVKPGMTGWAQVHGLRGDTSLEERIRHDLQYIENWSIWLDFVIQFRTFYQYKNAY